MMMTPSDLFGDIQYDAYRYNRKRDPEIPPAQWEIIFGARVTSMEQRYQQEISHELL